jgi:acetyl-CoA carboxylase carboxyl transferase alpha subunit
MLLAEKLRLPLVTLVDTPGAALSVDAEAGGLAQAISSCLSQLSALRVPIVSAIIGEGGSGGALALGVGDRVLMLENAIYSVIAPEGAAAILFRTKERAREVAESLKLTACDCLRLGVVDEVVAEPAGGAHVDPDRTIAFLRDALLGALDDLSQIGRRNLVEARYEKLRHLGTLSAG